LHTPSAVQPLVRPTLLLDPGEREAQTFGFMAIYKPARKNCVAVGRLIDLDYIQFACFIAVRAQKKIFCEYVQKRFASMFRVGFRWRSGALVVANTGCRKEPRCDLRNEEGSLFA